MKAGSDTIALYILACGAALSGGAFVLVGFESGLAAVAGTGVAIGNWFSIRWLIRRSLRRAAATGSSSVSHLLALLMLKLVILGVIAYLLIVIVGLDPLGFGLGLSSLGFGLGLGARSLSAAAAGDAEKGDAEKKGEA